MVILPGSDQQWVLGRTAMTLLQIVMSGQRGIMLIAFFTFPQLQPSPIYMF
jgi:hypothetical protein